MPDTPAFADRAASTPQGPTSSDGRELHVASYLPRMLRSAEDLEAAISASTSRPIYRSFKDICNPRHSASRPLYPTFTRFQHTPLANPNVSHEVELLVSPSSSPFEAVYDLSFPVYLNVFDVGCENGNSGLNLSRQDSHGYPLFYAIERPRKVIGTRTSAALYPNERLSASPRDTTHHANVRRTWAKMFKLSSPDTAELLLKRDPLSSVGDNHIALLMKAYLAFFDSICGALPGVQGMRDPVSAEGIVIDISRRGGWLGLTLAPSVQIVNVLDGDREYQEFWSYCCFERPPIFAARANGAIVATTPFSHYDMSSGPGQHLVCLCNCEAYSPTRQPYFFGRPDAILNYIELYVQRFDLQSQANEALQIAMLWPSLCRLDAHISLPQARHALDWLGERTLRNDEVRVSAYTGLLSSDPFLTLSSTLVGEQALLSQISDFASLISSGDTSDSVPTSVDNSAASWLAVRASASGLGWDFLLRHHFHVTPSFLYLTGLCDQPFDWHRCLGQQWQTTTFSAHLRLLQPFWSSQSIVCRLPWAGIWGGSGAVASGALIAEYTRELRCPFSGNVDFSDLDLHSSDNDLLDSSWHGVSANFTGLPLQDYNCRVVASLRPLFALQTRQRSPLSDDAQQIRAWPFAGVLGCNRVHDAMSDPLQATVYVGDVDHPDEKAVLAAERRVLLAKKRIADRVQSEIAESRRYLTVRGCQVYRIVPPSECLDRLPTTTVYRPEDASRSGHRCALWALQQFRQDQHSMASMRRQIDDFAGEYASDQDALSASEMTGVCVALEIPIICISDEHVSFHLIEDTSAQLKLHLRCSDNHWTVSASNSFTDTKVPEPLRRGYEAQLLPRTGECSLLAAQSHAMLELSAFRKQSQDTQLKLPQRARILDEAIHNWDLGVGSTSIVATLHRQLFPQAGLPRFLKESEMQAGPHAHPEELDVGSVILSFLRTRVGSDPLTVLTAFQSRFMDDDQRCCERWPSRSVQNRPKNNITMTETISLLCIDDAQEALALWFARGHQGNHGEFVAAVMLWLAAIDLCPAAWSELLTSELLDETEDTWLKSAQKLHEQWRKGGLRRCQCSDKCWVQLLYTQALWGRGGVQVDWATEITNKATPPDDILAFTGQRWSAGFASQIIKDTITEVVGSASSGLTLRTFDDFMDNAYEWLVSGSAAGLPSAFKDTPVRETLMTVYKITPRPTKRSVMEAIPRAHILEQLNTRPQIVAKLHQKLNETGGKARAIYGVTIWHYIFSNWLMAPIEKALNHPSIDMNLPGAKLLALRLRRIDGARLGACFSSYDYPDFNSMHTHEHMSLVYEAARDLVLGSATYQNWPEDERSLLVKGYEWLIESVFTQVCYLPFADEFIQSVGGLYSGNRDTTLVNTLLNVAYAKVVDISCRNMDLEPQVDWRLCHGDDIITQHGSYASALAWNVVADKANLKGQEKKILVDRSYHEYLRVMGCADGKLRGCIARTIASFVNGNWETDDTSGLHGQVVELEGSMATLTRRGMRAGFSSRLRTVIYERISGRFDRTSEEGDLIRRLLHELAGADDNPPSESSGRLITNNDEAHCDALQGVLDPPMRSKLDVERLFLSLPDEVTRPYMTSLLSDLPPDIQPSSAALTRLKMLLQKSTYGTELSARFQVEMEQVPQLRHLCDLKNISARNRGRAVRHIRLHEVEPLLGQHKVLSQTMQRIKAINTLLSVFGDSSGYSSTKLIAYVCKVSEGVVTSALATMRHSKLDWRRHCRPSAPELTGVENEVELLMTGASILEGDEEVVLVIEDGSGLLLPMRTFLLY